MQKEQTGIFPVSYTHLDVYKRQHVARISEADTDRIAPTFNVLDISNVLREDEPRQSVKSEEALKNAPERSSDGFKIPKID